MQDAFQDRPARAFVPPMSGTAAADTAPIPVLALTKSTGGLAVYHRALVAGLPRTEFTIHTLCLSDGAGTFAAELQDLGHSAEPLAMARYRLDLLGDLRVARAAARIARERQARVILCHGSKAGVIGRAVGWWLRIPAVYCQASLPFLPRVQGRKARLYRLIERSARLFDGHVVALTEGARALSLDHGVVAPGQISVIRTGIDLSRCAPRGTAGAVRAALGLAPDRPVILWIGRFEAQKAPEVFLDALDILFARNPAVQAVIVGEGGQREALAARIAASPHRDRLRLLPWQADPLALMEASDILCLSSRWEGLPLVLLEAMALEVVPVATAVDGIAEVVEDGRSGRLVPVDDPPALAAALAETLADPARCRAMGEAARLRVEAGFTAGRMLGEWADLLRRLAGSARR